MTENKQKAIIIDLDGTLCNTNHRQHFMQTNPKNWKSFYNALSLDEPNRWCSALIEGMISEGFAIIFVSGRPEDYREETIEWLKRHWFYSGPLFMRLPKDFRKDCLVKEEIYRKNIEPFYDILFCVDDRQQVVDMWRELGLTCLQCAKGDF